VGCSKRIKDDSVVQCREPAGPNSEGASTRQPNQEEDQTSGSEEIPIAVNPLELVITIDHLVKAGTTTRKVLLAEDKVATAIVRLHNEEAIAINHVTGRTVVGTISSLAGDKVAVMAEQQLLEGAVTTINRLPDLVVKANITTSREVVASTISSGIVTTSLAIGLLQVNSEDTIIHKLSPKNQMLVTSKAVLTSNHIVHGLLLRIEPQAVHRHYLLDNKEDVGMDSNHKEPAMLHKEGILNEKHRIRAVVLEGNQGATVEQIKLLVARLGDPKAQMHTGNRLNKLERGVMAKRKEAVMRIVLNLLRHKPMASNDLQAQEQATVQQLGRTTGNNRQDINNSPTTTELAATVVNHKE